MYVKRTVTLLLVLFILLFLSSCKKNEIMTPSGNLIDYIGCKGGGAENISQDTPSAQVQDCIEYQYDGDGFLLISHINSAFNCCPEVISAVISIQGSTITITETESAHGCHCMCLFDVNFQFQDLLPGMYTVQILETYIDGVSEGEDIFEITLDLSKQTSGKICIDRNKYPWL
jgi:hypothetical protein